MVDIKQDTLVFIGISTNKNVYDTSMSKDTTIINYHDIEKIYLVKDWGTERGKKFNTNNYYFIFSKLPIVYKLDSKFENVFPDTNLLTELVPRLSAHGITYHYEYGGKLYYHSGIKVKTPKYSDEEKSQILNGVVNVLDFLINKRVNVTIQKKN